LKARAGIKAAKMDYLPDVNLTGGYVGQSVADYVQRDFSFVGVTGSLMIFEWGKRKQVLRERATQMALAVPNVGATKETVMLDARKAFLACKQAEEELKIAGEVVSARQDAQKEAKQMPDIMAAAAATAKAQLDQMQAEVTYRVAHAKLLAAVGQP